MQVPGMHGSHDSTAKRLGKKVVSIVGQPLKAQMLQRKLGTLEKSWQDAMKIEGIKDWSEMSSIIDMLRIKNQELRAQLRTSVDERRELLTKAEAERQARWESFLSIVRNRPDKTEGLMRLLDANFPRSEGQNKLIVN